MSKILIFDDEPTKIVTITDRVDFEFGNNMYFYTPIYSSAIEYLRNNEVSCMSLDMIFPKDTNMKYDSSLIMGLNALREIRDIKPNLPIICYTIVEEIEAINEIQKYNAKYLGKNFKNSFYSLLEFFRAHQGK